MTNYYKTWRKRNPEKALAHAKVQNALRTGKLTRQLCDRCGRPDTHAHHEDYSRPLDVVWLCLTCHTVLHADKRGRKQKAALLPMRKPWHRHFQPAPKRDALIDDARRLRDEGRSYQQIADALHISIGTAYKWLNDVRYT